MTTQPPLPTSRSEFRARLHEHWQAAKERIERDTRIHRMADARLRLVAADGAALSGGDVDITQTRGPIRFGANAFMLGSLGSPEAESLWETRFAAAFDLAVVPFYWGDIEPVRGQPRFAADSPFRYRRPPPDAVLDFCSRHGIEPKAHPLTYHQFMPDWVPVEPVARDAAWEAWYAAVGQRYRGRIPSWDVVNEALGRYGWINADNPLPKDWIRKAFDAATRHLPGSRRILNEDTASWSTRGHQHFGFEMHPFSLLVENLLAKGLPIDELGLQFHCKDASETDHWKRASGAKDQPRMFEPPHLLAILDHYAGFGKPLHISEITIPCFGDDPDSQALQAEVAEMLYRTWFSHPAVASIVWWNTVDGHAHGPENVYKGGLLAGDLGEKAVYRALRRLIREEWRTCVRLDADAGGLAAFTGYRGGYRVEVRHGGRLLRGAFDLPCTTSEPIAVTCRPE